MQINFLYLKIYFIFINILSFMLWLKYADKSIISFKIQKKILHAKSHLKLKAFRSSNQKFQTYKRISERDSNNLGINHMKFLNLFCIHGSGRNFTSIEVENFPRKSKWWQVHMK